MADCPHCEPAIILNETKAVMPDGSPVMQRILAVWRASESDERDAYHRVKCLKSEAPEDVIATQALINRMEIAMNAGE